MLTIRLQRVGKKKIASYRLIVSENARDTQDVYLELLGTYNPHAKENQFQPVKDRIEYWLSKGSQTSDTVHNLLVKAGVIKGKTKKAVFLSKKRHAKIAEKKKASAPKEAPAAEVAPEAKS